MSGPARLPAPANGTPAAAGAARARTCACGRSSGAQLACDECRARRERGRSGAALRVGATSDPFEDEASQVAETVVQPWSGGNARRAGHGRRADGVARTLVPTRRGPSASGTLADAPAVVDEALAEPGMPLDERARAYFEPRFGHDFTAVRVHTSARAARSAQAIDARAYTVGRDIVFRAGAFAPASADGRRLLAHELAHTVQQGTDASPRVVRRLPEPGAATAPAPAAAPEPEIETAFRFRLGYQLTTVASDEPSHFYVINGPAGARVADLTGVPLYAGDSLLLAVDDQERKSLPAPVVQWSLPPELERVEEGDRRLLVRVVGSPPESESTRAADVQVSTGRAAESFTVKLAVRRAQAYPEGFSRDALPAGSLCLPDVPAQVKQALDRAIDVSSRAISSLEALRGDPAAMAAALDRAIPSRTGRRVPAVTVGDDAVVERLVDTLALARNSMRTADVNQVACVSAGDGFFAEHPKALAKVSAGEARGALVTLSQKWVMGDIANDSLRAGLAIGLDDSRAFALLHEFVHLAGPDTTPERYVDQGIWQRTSTTEALDMADFYAAVAFQLGR